MTPIGHEGIMFTVKGAVQYIIIRKIIINFKSLIGIAHAPHPRYVDLSSSFGVLSVFFLLTNNRSMI